MKITTTRVDSRMSDQGWKRERNSKSHQLETNAPTLMEVHQAGGYFGRSANALCDRNRTLTRRQSDCYFCIFKPHYCTSNRIRSIMKDVRLIDTIHEAKRSKVRDLRRSKRDVCNYVLLFNFIFSKLTVGTVRLTGWKVHMWKAFEKKLKIRNNGNDWHANDKR